MKAKLTNEGISIIDYDAECLRINNEYEYELTVNSVPDSIIDVILQKSDDERTVEDLQKIVIRKNIEDKKTERLKVFDGYKELVIEKYSGTNIQACVQQTIC